MPGINIAHYAHQDIDRFGVMQDLWSNEVAFMECKREVCIFMFSSFTLIFLVLLQWTTPCLRWAVLAHRIRISEILPWDRKSYLTFKLHRSILAYSGTSGGLF